MRVLLATYGSRGDVEPIVALAARLQARGAQALVCAPADEEFVALAARAGVGFAPAFMPVRQWISEARKLPQPDLPSFATVMVSAQFSAIGAAARVCDVVLATGLLPSTAAALAVSETIGARYVHVGFCPLFLPSPHHRPYAFPGRPLPPEETDNRTLWELNAKTIDELFGSAVNAHRASIGLPQLTAVRDQILTDRPWLASDPVLGPWRPAALDVVEAGAWILPDARPLPDALERFLDRGAPPAYLGFGSMAMAGAPDVAQVAVEALRALGLRALIARGWAGLDAVDDRDDCLVVSDVNQQALFPRVAVVVHHGGAGTTTTAARAGAPQVIVPQVADQPYWAARVAALGVGAAHDGPAPTVGSLSAALAIALAPDARARATALADKIAADGADNAAKLLLERIG